jgi:membrane associated rhomboid family serine protease
LPDSPPSIGQFWRYPVTSGAAIAAAVVYLLATPAGVEPLVLDVRAFEGEPWRLLTTALVHGGTLQSEAAGAGLLHVVFNCLWLFWLGAQLESHFGHARYGGFVLLTAIVSSAAEYGAQHTPVGLSGVVYAVVGIRWVLNRRHPRFAGTIPKKTLDFFVFWFFLCIALTISDTMPIANVAHGTGALIGYLVGRAIVDHRAKRAGALSAVAVISALSISAAGWARPHVNFGNPSAPDLFILAGKDFEAERFESARDRYRTMTRYRYPPPETFFNLALCELRLGQLDEAREALDQSIERYETAVQRAEKDDDPQLANAFDQALRRARTLRSELP